MPAYKNTGRSPRTLFCSAPLCVLFVVSFIVSFVQSFALPSVAHATGKDADSASAVPLSRPSAARHMAEDAPGPHFLLQDIRPVPGQLCRSCSGKTQASSQLKITTKEPLPERTSLPYAGNADSKRTADAPRAFPFKPEDASTASKTFADSAAAEPGRDVHNMVSEDLAKKLLLLVLPDAQCSPHPVSLTYTPANDAEKMLLSKSTSAKRPAIHKEDRQQMEKPAYRPCSMNDMAAVLHSLAKGRSLSEEAVHSLLGSAPGVLLRASSAYAADTAPNDEQTEDSVQVARQMLIVLTDPDCLFCRQAYRFLTRQRLPFSVLFLPLGSVSARSFYEYTLQPAASSTAYTENKRDVLSSWLAKTNDWLVQNCATGTISLPAFIWITDGTARMNTLSSKALQALVTAMTWRYELMMQHTAQEMAHVLP